MKALLLRACLGALFYATFKAFAYAAPLRPSGEDWDMVYFAGAATVDWIMYRITPLLTEGTLCRDIEALCIASIVAHAIGFALYMAWSPPYFHNWIIKGINYVLAIRLIYTGGGDVFNHNYWRDMVRGDIPRRARHVDKEAQG